MKRFFLILSLLFSHFAFAADYENAEQYSLLCDGMIQSIISYDSSGNMTGLRYRVTSQAIKYAHAGQDAYAKQGSSDYANDTFLQFYSNGTIFSPNMPIYIWSYTGKITAVYHGTTFILWDPVGAKIPSSLPDPVLDLSTKSANPASTGSNSTSSTTTTNKDASGNVTGTSTTTGTTAVDFSPVTARLDAINRTLQGGNGGVVMSGSGGGTGTGTGTDMTGTESRLDDVKTKLDTSNDHLDNMEKIAKNQENAEGKSVHDSGLSTNQSASAAISSATALDGGFGSGGLPGRGGYDASGATSGAALVAPLVLNCIPGHLITIQLDPVAVALNNGFGTMFAIGRALISAALVVCFYKYIIKAVGPLVAGAFNSDAASTSVVETGQAGIVVASGGFQVSATRPILSAARIALALSLPLAILAAINLYTSVAPSAGGDFFGTTAIIGNMISSFRAALGRAFDLLNLLLPIDFMLIEGIYSAVCASVIYSIFYVMKAKSAALQSI